MNKKYKNSCKIRQKLASLESGQRWHVLALGSHILLLILVFRDPYCADCNISGKTEGLFRCIGYKGKHEKCA